ncbi:MAG: cytochrome C oxidase subunit IV family protein [Terracidiphilus sp.]|nr:cytochrome C oxidase subunit IV family protein [Terracidiphilus sp.]
MNEPNEQTAYGDQTHHIVGPKVYVVILLALLVGTGLTVWASFLELGIWNPIVALAIATGKALLVVLFFMHVKYSTKLTKLTVGAAIFMFLALISMTLADYMSRAWGRW